MAHALYIDPVTGDDICCREDDERERAEHWKEVAKFLATLVMEDDDEARAYAIKVEKAT